MVYSKQLKLERSVNMMSENALIHYRPHKQQRLTFPSEIVTKSNLFIRSGLKNVDTVYAGRIFASIVACIKREDSDFKPYAVPCSSVLQPVFADDGKRFDKGNISGHHYEFIDKATSKLAEAFVKLPHENNNPDSYQKIPLFASIYYDCGVVYAEINPKLKEHFIQLANHFTRYGMLDYASLSSTYSQRLFEILMSWNDRLHVTITLEQLQDALDVPDSLKPYSDFRRWVLNQAHKEINRTNLSFEWRPIKQGRKVDAIKFYLGRDEIARLIKEEKEALKNQNQKQADANNKLFLSVVHCRKQKGLKNNCMCLAPDCAKQKQSLCLKMFCE